ncbi:delphilin-like [Dorcoceras hygrometricum]|uniref:Delphilin-like n=1 Tax=Dorcoceras hygrometricum TaxID=472368 RepID=A0A2Z7B9G7_9LAMI|nr:delphilin-like [Dorcoceras hygrometricum]
MKIKSDKIPSRRNDRKVLVAEESTKSWADSDSESSSSSSSSSDSEQEEVHCLMADHMDDDEVFDFSNVEFTHSAPSCETLKTDLLRKSYFRHSLHSKSTTMASIFIVNSYQINFESVLMIPDHDGMLNMFKALEASGLRGFLGCESVLYEKELQQFFETALVQGEYITGTVSGKFFSISQAQFARVFELPTEGVVNFSEVPKDIVYDSRSFFSKNGEQVEIHGKKKPMKYEFRLLNDILAKAVTVKAGSFDVVTVERFQMMTAIHYGLKVNWGKVLFNVIKDMVDKSQRKAKGFAAQIGVLLKGIPAVTLGEGVPFPFAKILSMKTVNTYIATNTTIDAREEQGMVGEATEKRKSKSTKKSSSADNTPVKVISEVSGSKKRVATEDIALAIPTKRRTVKTKHSSSQESLDIMPVAQYVVPIQVIDPTPAAVAIKSPALKRKSRKRRLVLTTGSDDETMDQQELVKDTDKAAAKTSDEVDIIIEQVLEETLLLGVSEEEHGGQGVDEAAFADDFAQWLDDFLPGTLSQRLLKQGMSQALRIARRLPRFGLVNLFQSLKFGTVMYILPAFPAFPLKGKAILEEDEPIQGNPARELVEIICGDIEILIRIRDQVMVDVVEFFHSFSLNTLSNFDALLALKAKEKLMLEWAERDSLAMAVKRKGYILAKYRELLLRRFLKSHKKFLAPGQPWTATTSKIIDLLSDAHSISLEDLLAQQRAHGLQMEQPCASSVFESSIDSGVVLARFYSMEKSTCWVRPMILIDGIWTPLQGPDFWKSGCHLSLFLNQKKMPKPAIEDIFALHVSLVEPVQYWEPAPYLIKTWVWLVIVLLQEVDSVEHDLQFALPCPAIFPSVAQEERLYFVQSPASSPATYQPQESSSSSTDVSMHFDSADIPLNAQADSQASAPVDFTMFTDALEDLRSSISQCIHDSNCEILSKVNAVEIGVREALFKQHALLRQSLQDAYRVQERHGVIQEMQINDLKKGLLSPVATVFQDLMAIKKVQREQDAKLTALDNQVAAIRNEQLDFQSKIAADILSLSTQFGDIVDHIRGDDAKKGEIGSSSRRPPPIRVERHPLPTPANQGESISGHGRVPSVEEAAEMIREADRQADRREREREREKRLRRLRRRGH